MVGDDEGAGNSEDFPYSSEFPRKNSYVSSIVICTKIFFRHPGEENNGLLYMQTLRDVPKVVFVFRRS